MKDLRYRFALLQSLLIGLLIAQPILAERPPSGYGRPPIHMKPFAMSSPTGLTPNQVQHAYGFDQLASQIGGQGAGQTIGIVDAYDDPNIANDLAVFSSTFGLPQCNTSNPCFQKIYASGFRPAASSGWSLEIALDVEWAHAIAPQARILLVEAASSSFSDLLHAVDVAVQSGASVVSMSWGGSEFSTENSYDSHFMVSGVTFTASSGDSGNGAEYPAASPYVISVGGTTLNIDGSGNYLGESAWNGSGGGQGVYEAEPLYQANYPIPNDPNHDRGIPDVAYDGDPNTGFSVYDSVRYQGQRGWFQVGGTSAGSPQWAALFAIANAMRQAGGKLPLGSASSTNNAVYSLGSLNVYTTTNYHDNTSGSNGSCGVICNASSGYDYVTGLGSPQANNIIPALVAY